MVERRSDLIQTRSDVIKTTSEPNVATSDVIDNTSDLIDDTTDIIFDTSDPIETVRNRITRWAEACALKSFQCTLCTPSRVGPGHHSIVARPKRMSPR
jgi:hypothetical protein